MTTVGLRSKGCPSPASGRTAENIGFRSLVEAGRLRDYNAVPIRGTMAHTFTCLYYHVVFGTRFRRPLITTEIRPRLWAYMGGIARENRLRALTINGMADHAHMLISLNPAIALSDAIKEIKAGSSAWMSRTTGKDSNGREATPALR